MPRPFLVSFLLLTGVTANAGALAQTPPPAAPPAVDKSQEIICRKEKETGSLVRTRKTCHSRAQWAYIDDTNQNFSRQLVDDSRTKSGSN